MIARLAIRATFKTVISLKLYLRNTPYACQLKDKVREERQNLTIQEALVFNSNNIEFTGTEHCVLE